MAIEYIIDNSDNSLGTQSIAGTVSVDKLRIANITSTSGLTNYVVVDGSGNTFYQTGAMSVEAENGLTSSGGVIRLGGDLNQNTLINGTSYNLNINNLNSFSLTSSGVNVSSQLLVSSTYSRIQSFDVVSGEYTFISIQNDILNLRAFNPGSGYFTGLDISSYGQVVGDGSISSIVISDPWLQRGISYLGDYTSNFSTYSLVTKGYVDSVVSGSSGTSGQNGSSGTSGVDGNFLGSSGTSGQDGSSGTSGIDGTSGTSGIDGTSGTSGIDGTSGTSGIDGTSGTSGIDGTSGTSGFDGTSGTSGIDGTSGTSGFDGSSGTSGFDGSSGTSGNSATFTNPDQIAAAFGIPSNEGCYLLKICYDGINGYSLTYSIAP